MVKSSKASLNCLLFFWAIALYNQGFGLSRSNLIAIVKSLIASSYFFRKISVIPLLIKVPGVFVALELKAENGKIGKLQKYKLDKITESGGLAFEVRPSNWDKILETLKKL